MAGESHGTGWMVTCSTAGQAQPQQASPQPTTAKPPRHTVSRVPRQPRKRLLPDDVLAVKENRVTLEVPAGGVRVIELK